MAALGVCTAPGLCAIAVIGSYSRGGLLAIIAMVFFLWLKSRRKALLLLLLPPVLLLGLSVMPERWFERMGPYGATSRAIPKLRWPSPWWRRSSTTWPSRPS
ncbi:hypothetical protein F1712_11660, partial [Streptococcus pneumoniae]